MKYASATYHQTQHLKEEALLPEVCQCPWCRSSQIETLTLLQAHPDVSLLNCGRCHAVSASRMPSAAALSRYYGAYYAGKRNTDGAPKVTLGNPMRLGRHLSLAARKAGVSGRVRMLDFGGGDGTLSVLTAQELLDHGQVESVEITVVDYSVNLKASPDSRISVRGMQTLDEVEESEFQMVVASAVIEHIPDAPDVLRRLLSLVGPAGLFYTRTPQIKSFVVLAGKLGMKWDFTFPAHVYDLGQNFWESYFAAEHLRERFTLLSSKPSTVEASFRESPLRAGLAVVFKVPWYVLRQRWGFVGGWEILARRNQEMNMTTMKES